MLGPQKRGEVVLALWGGGKGIREAFATWKGWHLSCALRDVENIPTQPRSWHTEILSNCCRLDGRMDACTDIPGRRHCFSRGTEEEKHGPRTGMRSCSVWCLKANFTGGLFLWWFFLFFALWWILLLFQLCSYEDSNKKSQIVRTRSTLILKDTYVLSISKTK